MSSKEFIRELRYILNNVSEVSAVKVAAIKALVMLYKMENGYVRAEGTSSDIKLA